MARYDECQKRIPEMFSSLRAVAAGAVIALSACGSSDPGGSYFPLVEGVHWQYRVERTTMDGVRELRHAISTAGVPATDRGYTAMRETVDGQRYFYTATDEGIFRVAEHTPGADAPRFLAEPQMVLPAAPTLSSIWEASSTTAVLENSGPPWETLFRITVPITIKYRVESESASVITPAGRFDRCLKIAGKGTTNSDVGNYIGQTTIDVETTEWYAPAVGLVRMERTERTTSAALNHGRIEMTLDRWWRE